MCFDIEYPSNLPHIDASCLPHRVAQWRVLTEAFWSLVQWDSIAITSPMPPVISHSSDFDSNRRPQSRAAQLPLYRPPIGVTQADWIPSRHVPGAVLVVLQERH